MTDNTLRQKLMPIADMFLSVQPAFGLYQVWPKVKYGLHIADDRQFKRYGDSKLVLRSDQTPDAVVARTEKEWDAAKGDPNINDICWFE